MIEMLETIEKGPPKVVGLHLSGRLHDEDYQQFVPTIEPILTANGKTRLFVQFEDFHGWDLHAAWDELKFAVKHYSDFERMAVVGDRKWEEWVAGSCRPFTKAKVKYFDQSQVDAAWIWLREETQGHQAVEEKDRPLVVPSEANGPIPWVWQGL